MNTKTNSLEKHVNFVDDTKKQNKVFKLIIILFVNMIVLFLFFVSFKYLND